MNRRRGNEQDDDCYEIPPVDFTRKLNLRLPSDDVILLAETGPIALRDFPHPRPLCANFPFHTTSHERYCSQCFCCVCEVAAPCSKWKGYHGHCNASIKEHN